MKKDMLALKLFALFWILLGPARAQNQCGQAQTLLQDIQGKIFDIKGAEGKNLLALQIEYDHLSAKADIAELIPNNPDCVKNFLGNSEEACKAEELAVLRRARIPASLSPETGGPVPLTWESLEDARAISQRRREVDQAIEQIKGTDQYRTNILFRRYIFSQFEENCGQQLSLGGTSAVCARLPEAGTLPLATLLKEMQEVGMFVSRQSALTKLNRACKQRGGEYPEDLCAKVSADYQAMKEDPEVEEQEKISRILSGPSDTIVYRDADGNAVGTYRRQNAWRPWLMAGAERLASFGQWFVTHYQPGINQMELANIQMDNGGGLVWYTCPEANPYCNYYSQETWDAYVKTQKKYQWAYHRAIQENAMPLNHPERLAFDY